MLEYLKMETSRTLTENGAATWTTSQSDCLDLFATAGALRGAEDSEIRTRFERAFREDPDLAMKILFYSRDVRGGLGERRLFRVILRRLAQQHPESVRKNIPYIAEFGRYDDLLCLLETPCEKDAVERIRQQLNADTESLAEGEEVSLLAKWLPSVNASNEETVRQAKRLARLLGMREREYRQTLTALRARIRILENALREGDYTFRYEAQPSKALYKYRRAFLRNDEERYLQFINRAKEDPSVLHTGTLTPYDIVRPLFFRPNSLSEEEREVMDVTWNAQEDFTGDENALVVADGSGSMYWGGDPVPAAVAQSLAIYFAERNTGVFHNHFITFSEHPQLVEISGGDIADKVRWCQKYNEIANTDLEAVFRLILDTAVKYRVPQEELPARLYIISDMEFDRCMRSASLTNFENAGVMFEARGYRLPEVVFWNVCSRNLQQPVQKNEQGAALVSGCSPHIFRLLRERILDPYSVMMDVLSQERYSVIAA